MKREDHALISISTILVLSFQLIAENFRHGMSLIPIGQLIWRLITRGEQALFNLEIKKKSGSSLNPDIHHSKVPSSGYFLN